MLKHTRTAAALIAALALTACAGTSGGEGTAEAGSNRPTTSTHSAPTYTPSNTEPPAETPTEEEPTDSGPVAFGQTYAYDDGLSVLIESPKKYTPSDSAFTEGKANAFVTVQVTILNKTGKTYDPSMFMASMQSANEEAEQIWDTAKGIEGAPTTKLLDGRESKFKIAFGVQDAKDLVMEVAPGFEYESAIFTNS